MKGTGVKKHPLPPDFYEALELFRNRCLRDRRSLAATTATGL